MGSISPYVREGKKFKLRSSILRRGPLKGMWGHTGIFRDTKGIPGPQK